MSGKTAKKIDPLKMTMRQAFNAFYDKSDLTKNTLGIYEVNLRRWEDLTTNPPVGKITDEMFDRFKLALFERGLSPASINMTRRAVISILRRLGPRESRNPGARGFLKTVAYTKAAREIHPMPRRLELDAEISRFYLSCSCMTSPNVGRPAEWWWQGLVCWIFCTGQRLRDALRTRYADIDFERATVRFTARKTLKAAEMPLHWAAIEHVRRIQTDREFVFQSKRLYVSGDFHHSWRKICNHAKLDSPFTPRDLRKTAASEINRAAASKSLPPMAGVLLQHSSRSVTDLHYSNQIQELREALAALRMPVAFLQGPKEAQRQLDNARAEAAKAMRRAQMAPATFPHISEWCFTEPFGFGIRGVYVPMRGGARRIVEALATSPTQRCDCATLVRAIWPDGGEPDTHRLRQGRVCDCLHTVRMRLRLALNLPPTYDPVPCVSRGAGGVWQLFLPAQKRDGAA